MRCHPAAFALVLLTACAPPQPGLGPQNTPERVRVREDGTNTLYDITVTSNRGVATETLPVPVERVWPLLAEVYREMELPVTAADPERRLLASESGAVRGRRVAGSSLIRFLECGRSPAGGPLVATAPISLTVRTLARPLGEESTTIQTVVNARAQDPVHNNAPASCTSTGRLEAEIARRLRARLGA